MAALVLLSFAAVPVSGQQKNTSDPARSDTGVASERGSALPQSRRPRNRKKPRLSNVGYVDAVVIGTPLQFRFDSSKDIDFPDRAKFIYAKCGCYRKAGLDSDAPGPTGELGGGDPTTTRFIPSGLKMSEIVLDGEIALNEKVSLFAEIPLSQRDPQLRRRSRAGRVGSRGHQRWRAGRPPRAGRALYHGSAQVVSADG